MPDSQILALAQLAGSLPCAAVLQIKVGGKSSANEKYFPVTEWRHDFHTPLTQSNFSQNMSGKTSEIK